MDKLPTKDELLRQQKKEAPLPTGETPDVRKAKDDAEISAQNLKKRENEIKLKLQEEGYKSIEDGLIDIKKKLEEADSILANAKQEEQTITQEREALEAEKQKLLNAYKIVKDNEAKIDARLEQAIKLENARQSNMENRNAVIGELKFLMQYHLDNIKPCRKALYNVSLGIYNFADALNSARVDFTPLYNFIGRTMRQIDKYVDAEGKKLPTDILEELQESEKKEPSDKPKSA
jgi:chromosome segregation ATPase